MVPTSNFPQNLAGWAAPNGTGNTYSYVAAPDGTSSAVKVSFAGDGFNQPFPSLVVGTVYTFSFYAKNETATDVTFFIRLGSSDGVGVAGRIPANTAWTRYSVTRTYQAGDSILRWYFSTKNVEVSLWGAQLEALPFASSYIPTNGAAVTRAADVAKLPQARNIPDLLGSSYSIAARFTLKPGVIKAYRFLFRTGNDLNESMGIVQVNSGATLRAYQGSANLGNNNVVLPFVEGSSFVCGLGIRSGKVVGYSSVDRAVVASPSPFTPNSNQANFLLGDLRLMANYQPNNEAWGHIRDLRIWWQALSDEQWKVVS